MLLILKPDRIVARDNIFGPVGSITFVMATACLDHRSRVRVNLRLRGHAYHLGGCRRISSLRHLVAELQNKSSPSNRRGTGKAERIIARTSIARESRRGCRGEGTYEARHRGFCSSSSCFPQTDLRKHRWPPQVGADEKLDWRSQAITRNIKGAHFAVGCDC